MLACFATAIFAWGFGFYGQSVYVAQLHASRGWSAALISSATTLYYLAGALLLARVAVFITRFGPLLVLAGGSAAMGAGASIVAWAAAPWQMFIGSMVMALAWACTSSTAIATTLALRFDRQRGLAISLALNGASVAGFSVAPLLVWASARYGLGIAVAATAGAMLCVLLPLIVLCTRGRGETGVRHAAAAAPDDGRIGIATTKQGLRSAAVWSVALPFGLALMAQVGLIVHLVAFLLPRLGASGAGMAVGVASFAAMGGRLALGVVIDRLNQRRASAISFASQAAGVLLMLGAGDSATALYVGCIAFGLSVGNVITLPSLIVQREFTAASFGIVVGLSTAIGQVAYAFAPSLLGVVHDAAGGYGPALALVAVIQILASVLVLRHPAQGGQDFTGATSRAPDTRS